VTNFFGLDSVQKHAFDLKQLNDAVSLRNHILSVYERAAKETDPQVREALMTFVVVGGGPTGVEFAGSLSELTHHVLTKDFPELHPEKSRIIMLEAMDRLLAPFPAELQQYTLQKLEKMGVEVRLNTAVACSCMTVQKSLRTLCSGRRASRHLLWPMRCRWQKCAVAVFPLKPTCR
jgi:NADH dehydrogenase